MQRHGCDSTHAEKKLFIAGGQKRYLCKTSETNRAEAKNYPSLFSLSSPEMCHPQQERRRGRKRRWSRRGRSNLWNLKLKPIDFLNEKERVMRKLQMSGLNWSYCKSTHDSVDMEVIVLHKEHQEMCLFFNRRRNLCRMSLTMITVIKPQFQLFHSCMATC